jgi:hypothetical protein
VEEGHSVCRLGNDCQNVVGVIEGYFVDEITAQEMTFDCEVHFELFSIINNCIPKKTKTFSFPTPHLSLIHLNEPPTIYFSFDDFQTAIALVQHKLSPFPKSNKSDDSFVVIPIIPIINEG